MGDADTTAELRTMLRRRALGPPRDGGQGNRAVFLEEVRAGVGADRGRTADVLTLGLWPSRGLLLEGFELKASRSDWRGELDRPEKADAVARYCDRWWLVTVPDVVHAGELPPTWGLLVRKGRKLVCEVEAPPLEPVAPDRQFLAALLRRCYSQDRAAEMEAFREETEQHVRDSAQFDLESWERRLERERELNEKHEALWARFAERTEGWTFSRFVSEADIDFVARIAVALKDGGRGVGALRSHLQRDLSTLETVRASVNDALAQLEAAES